MRVNELDMLKGIFEEQRALTDDEMQAYKDMLRRKEKGELMTIEGAIAELQNLIKADDVPFYYNGVIKKIIETIIDERPVKCIECIHFDYDGVSDYGRCSKKDVYEWHYKPTDFCSSGDRRADYTVFTVNPPKGIETPLKGDATVFHKSSKITQMEGE